MIIRERVAPSLTGALEGLRQRARRAVHPLRFSLSDVWVAAVVIVPAIALLPAKLWMLDLAYHLRAGNLMLAGHHVLRADPFSFASNAEWLDQQWAAQIVLAAVFRSGGWLALEILRVVLASGIALLLFAACRRRGAYPKRAAVIAIVAMIGVFPGLILRPQLFGLVLFALVQLILLERDRRPRLLLLVPPLFAIWANMHGTFPLGLVLIALAVIEQLEGRRTIKPLVGPRRIDPLDRRDPMGSWSLALRPRAVDQPADRLLGPGVAGDHAQIDPRSRVLRHGRSGRGHVGEVERSTPLVGGPHPRRLLRARRLIDPWDLLVGARLGAGGRRGLAGSRNGGSRTTVGGERRLRDRDALVAHRPAGPLDAPADQLAHRRAVGPVGSSAGDRPAGGPRPHRTAVGILVRVPASPELRLRRFPHRDLPGPRLARLPHRLARGDRLAACAGCVGIDFVATERDQQPGLLAALEQAPGWQVLYEGPQGALFARE